MTSHIKLMGIMLNVIIGVALLAYIHHQRRRFSDRVLDRLMLYSSTVVIGILLFYLAIYLQLNIQPFMTTGSILVPESAVYFLIYIIMITLSFSVISICFLLTGKNVPPGFRKAGIAMAAVPLLGFVAHTFFPGIPAIGKGAHFILENFGLAFVLAELFFLVRLPIITRDAGGHRDAGTARRFSLLFLSRYLVILPLVFLLPSLVRGFVFMVVFQGIAFAWLRWSYVPHREKLALCRDARQLASELAHRHGLTSREEEILLLMLQGKNNREIENILYISYNTVKNHIHAIYGKTGISNRFQLFRSLGQSAGSGIGENTGDPV